MAKRKRKMTLFDVINSGQPIGINVRQRIPTYQPTPELPVKKKLAKFFGRKPKDGRDPNQPLSAAEELELLRRELGGKSPPVVRETAPAPTQEPAEENASHEVEEPAAFPFTRVKTKASRNIEEDAIADEHSGAESDPTARFFSARNNSRTAADAIRTPRRAAEVAREIEVTPPAPPRKPRKPMRLVLNESWGKVAPHAERARALAQRVTLASFSKAQASIESLRNVNTQHAATIATAISGILVLGGAFYVGKVLLQRPASDTSLVDANGVNTTPRPDVLDVSSGQAVANVSRSAAEISLEKASAQQPQLAVAPSSVFGGRNTDLNYVIVQSYYSQAEADAAVDVLAKYGISTTVEKNLPGWRSGERDFFSVVSSDGYAKMKDNAVYQAFLVTLGKISDRETGATLPKRLDPRPYKFVRSAQ
jgi:hypothetical protein